MVSQKYYKKHCVRRPLSHGWLQMQMLGRGRETEEAGETREEEAQEEERKREEKRKVRIERQLG